MYCDRANKKILVYIGSKTVECDGEPNTINVISKDKLKCPDYNMVCTSNIWCNNMFECIDKNSVTDENTFLLKTNLNQLQLKDNYNLHLDTSSKYSTQFADEESKYIWQNFILQLILFVFVLM